MGAWSEPNTESHASYVSHCSVGNDTRTFDDADMTGCAEGCRTNTRSVYDGMRA